MAYFTQREGALLRRVFSSPQSPPPSCAARACASEFAMAIRSRYCALRNGDEMRGNRDLSWWTVKLPGDRLGTPLVKRISSPFSFPLALNIRERG